MIGANDATLITVSLGAPDALALMWETWNHHHPGDWRWIVQDQGHCPEALDYAKRHTALVFEGENAGSSHGERITELLEYVHTPYVLHLDNDLEFTGPVIDTLAKPFEEDDKVYCSCLTRLWHPVNEYCPMVDHTMRYPYGTFNVFDMELRGMWSPNIALGLMRMDVVGRLFREWDVTFGYYMNPTRREYFETGGMAFRMCMAMGYTVAEIGNLWNHVVHWGSLSTLWAGRENEPVIRDRYERCQKRLIEFRNDTACPYGAKSGLVPT